MKRYAIEIFRGVGHFPGKCHWTTVKDMAASDKHDGIPEGVIRSFHNYKRNNPSYKYRLVEVFFWTEGGKKPFQDSELEN